MSETRKTTTTRRAMMGSAGLAALAGIAVAAVAMPAAQAVEMLPTAHGNAALIALADQFMAVQRRVDILNAGHVESDDNAMDDAVEEQAAILEEMHPLRATTAAGHRARARVFAAWYGIEQDRETGSEIDHDRLWPLLRDLIGEHA